MFVRRDAIDAVGPPDGAFFLFSEETDWCYRFRREGWQVVYYPEAKVVHVSGASHGGRLFRENVRSHLRFFVKHHGVREAERARRLMLWALRLRGVLFRRERGRMYRDTASWLASGNAQQLVDEPR
jgi:N-acetylglucosaminyl-diphospho-decaprenol L-rhamnosyltransferase